LTSKSEFEGKVGLVTGATSGIGRATAIEFAAAGANVVATGRRVDRGLELEAESSSLPGSILFVKSDVKIADDVKRMVGTAVDRFGKLDFAFNNAGGSTKSPSAKGRLHLYEEEDWDDYSDMYLKSVWRCMKHEIEVMLPAGSGVIVNTSSIAGLVGHPNAAYAAAKHGVIGMTKSASQQYAGEGLRFITICPGWVDTEMMASAKENEALSKYILGRSSVKRPADPSEIASLVKWLCSDGAAFVDGAAWPIDGGYTV
jgi:NAD(P)-dependent dehydrogenase (short-subunit alcohol dehydrogenase family)